VFALFRWKPIRSIVEITVVVGSVTVVLAKEAHQVIARAVHESVICIIIISPATGVQVRFVVILVIACASPVIWNISPLSVFIAGAAACVVTTTRLVTRLFVSVLVLIIVGIVTPSTAITPAAAREIVVSVACPMFTPVNCGLSLVHSPIKVGIAVTLSSSITPVPAVLLPRIRLVFMLDIPASGKPVQFVSVPLVGVQRTGVVSAGDVIV